MFKTNIPQIYNVIKRATIKHSPEILTGIGIVGMVSATIMAVQATPKALILIEEEKRAQNAKLLEEAKENNWDKVPKVTALKPVDVIKTTWKCYLPATITGLISIACIVGASKVHLKRNAALAAVYTLSESTLKTYRNKVVDTIGEKKEAVIREAVSKEKMDNTPVQSREVILTEKGNTLCFDAVSGRYFKSDIDKIKKAENELNHRLISEMYISLNEFYSEINLPTVIIGDNIGWNVNDGLIDIQYSSQLASDGTPCLVIDFVTLPRYDYTSLH